MTKSRMAAVVATLALSLMGSAAQAGSLPPVVAGWDFSQYGTAGVLTTDGTNRVATLGANYSNSLTAGAGDASAQGVMLMNGTFGSTAINPNAAKPGVVPVFGSAADYDGSEVPGVLGAVESNAGRPGVALGVNQFDAFSVLRDSGQSFTTRAGLSSNSGGNDSVVFRVLTAGNGAWDVSFGGRTFEGTSSVGVDYDVDCTGSYLSAGTASLDQSDRQFSFSLGAHAASTLCVRLGLDSSLGQPVVDNVAIAVPEPGVMLALPAGLLGLFGLARMRRAD